MPCESIFSLKIFDIAFNIFWKILYPPTALFEDCCAHFNVENTYEVNIQLKMFVWLNSNKKYMCIKKRHPTIKKGKKEIISSCKETLRDMILPNLMILLLMIHMNLMGGWEMQEYNSPSHGKLHKKRRATRRLTNRITFTTRILQMEEKFKNMILKSIALSEPPWRYSISLCATLGNDWGTYVPL